MNRANRRLNRGVPLVFLVAVGLAGAAARAEEPKVVGYRGHRNGCYANCDPPMTWNDVTGENIAWRTHLPNWCLGQPVVVGDKVFVMSEPGWKSDFP